MTTWANWKCLDWAKEDEVGAQQSGTSTTTHLWEESWDDDDTTDDFSVQLKYAILLSAEASMGYTNGAAGMS
jgi:hypothetical protein